MNPTYILRTASAAGDNEQVERILRDNPEFLRRTAASIKAGLAFFGESKERQPKAAQSGDETGSGR